MKRTFTLLVALLLAPLSNRAAAAGQTGTPLGTAAKNSPEKWSPRANEGVKWQEMNTTQKQFSLNRGASKSKFLPVSCIASQMITKIHHDGSFWFNASGNNTCDQMIVPATGRRIISISGTADTVIPYAGGSGVGTTFMHSQESIYRFAEAMGETGPKLADAAGIPGNLTDADPTNNYSPVFVKYAYRNGQVVHYKLIGGDHGLGVGGSTVYATEAKQIIAAFLLQ
jgi:hypothetical protein